MAETATCVFLNRSLIRMKKFRKPAQVKVSNGLESRVVPLAFQMTFESATEDVLLRTGKKRRFSQLAQDVKMQRRARENVLKRLKTVNEQTGVEMELSPVAEEPQQPASQPAAPSKRSVPKRSAQKKH